jgi:hypothetical protein
VGVYLFFIVKVLLITNILQIHRYSYYHNDFVGDKQQDSRRDADVEIQ